MVHTLRSVLLGGIGLIAFVATGEFACRALPVSTATSTGYRIAPLILTYPPHTQIAFATGWDLKNPQLLRTNNLGFVSERDFTPDPRAVALIGDSHVEASMLDAAHRPGAQLAHRLGPDRPVYAMGCAGTSLLDYAERVRYASQHLAVRDFVVFVDGGDVHQSLCGSGNINGPCLDPKTLAPRTELRAEASTLKSIIRQAALAQYLFSQLRLSPDQVWPALKALPSGLLPRGHGMAASQAQAPPAPGIAPAVADHIAQTFLDRVRPHVLGRLVLVINSPQAGVKPGHPDEDNQRLAVLARDQGVTVVSMRDAYLAHAARSALSLYVGPYDHHLNKLGTALVAEVAAQALKTAAPWPTEPAGTAPAIAGSAGR